MDSFCYQTGSPEDYDQFRLKLESYIRVKMGSPEELSAEEISVLRYLSRDQKTPYSITPEDRILGSQKMQGEVEMVLKSLVYAEYLKILQSISDNMPYYQITGKAEKLLFRRWKYFG